MSDDVDRVRARVDIVGLISESVSLKRAGKSWKGLCPFHQDTNPSFSVTPDIGRYRCWACGEHGDAFTWVMKTQQVDFPEALRILAERTGVELTRRKGDGSTKRRKEAMEDALGFFRKALPKSRDAMAYVENRGLDTETIDAWELGYAPRQDGGLATTLSRAGHKLTECAELFLVARDGSGGYYDQFRGRLMFPIRDERGHLVAFGGRILGDGHPKYINSSDTPIFHKSRVLYGMHRAKKAMADKGHAVLVEGYMDVIACHRGGVEEAVANLGTALTEEHAKLIARWAEKATVFYDSDEAGQKAAERSADELAKQGLIVRVATLPKGEDPDSLLESGGPDALKAAIQNSIAPLEFRIRRVQAANDPDDETYWKRIVDVLAVHQDALEVERHLTSLATLYPGIADPTRAAEALRTMVDRARREGPSLPVEEPDEPERPRIEAPKVKLPILESTVFRALLDEDCRQKAWDACGDAELFSKKAAVSLAKAVRTTFPDEPPQGPASVWIDRFEKDTVVAYFAALAEDDTHPISLEEIGQAIDRLMRRKLESASQRLKANPEDEDAQRRFQAARVALDGFRKES